MFNFTRLTFTDIIMKNYITSFILVLFLLPCITFAQEESPPKDKTKINFIRNGFTLKLGPVFPVGNFAMDQVIHSTETFYPAAKIGGNLSMGYLIYIGPALANNILRFGIDATFLDGWFATASRPAGSDKKAVEYWYTFVGQKFGPLITINPVDKLMIDLSYKLNANISWHDSDWGASLLGQEIMMNIRYRIIVFSFMYNFGTINYNDFDKSRLANVIDISTFRVLLGFKF